VCSSDLTAIRLAPGRSGVEARLVSSRFPVHISGSTAVSACRRHCASGRRHVRCRRRRDSLVIGGLTFMPQNGDSLGCWVGCPIVVACSPSTEEGLILSSYQPLVLITTHKSSAYFFSRSITTSTSRSGVPSRPKYRANRASSASTNGLSSEASLSSLSICPRGRITNC